MKHGTKGAAAVVTVTLLSLSLLTPAQRVSQTHKTAQEIRIQLKKVLESRQQLSDGSHVIAEGPKGQFVARVKAGEVVHWEIVRPSGTPFILKDKEERCFIDAINCKMGCSHKAAFETVLIGVVDVAVGIAVGVATDDACQANCDTKFDECMKAAHWDPTKKGD